MRHLPVLALLTLAIGVRPPLAAVPSEARIETFQLESRVLGNTRTLRVWLPPGYDDPARGLRYPVLYLNDGQNLFDSGETERPRSWRAGRTAGTLIREGRIEPVVIVGIDHAPGRGRDREYLPWPDTFLDPPEPDPQGRRFVELMRDEVLPAVEARYRVRRDRGGRAFGGSSYGALIALYVTVTDTTLFDEVLLESPSLYVDDGQIFDLLRREGNALSRVYLGVGTNEVGVDQCGDHPWNREAVRDVRRMAALLEETAREQALQVEVVVESCAVHGEAAWSRRLPGALEHLFPRVDGPGAEPSRDPGRPSFAALSSP